METSREEDSIKFQKWKFKKDQEADPVLEQSFKMVSKDPVTPGNPERYFEEKGLLYRKILINSRREGENLQKLLIVPSKYKQKIMEKGHTNTCLLYTSPSPRD